MCFCVCDVCVCVYAVRWVRCRPLSPPFFWVSGGGASMWLLFLFWSFVVGCLFFDVSFIHSHLHRLSKEKTCGMYTMLTHNTHLASHTGGGVSIIAVNRNETSRPAPPLGRRATSFASAQRVHARRLVALPRRCDSQARTVTVRRTPCTPSGHTVHNRTLLTHTQDSQTTVRLERDDAC